MEIWIPEWTGDWIQSEIFGTDIGAIGCNAKLRHQALFLLSGLVLYLLLPRRRAEDAAAADHSPNHWIPTAPDAAGFLFEESGEHCGSLAERFGHSLRNEPVAEEVPARRSAHQWRRYGKEHPMDPCRADRKGAHRAWLHAGIERTTAEVRRPERLLGERHGEQLGMPGNVLVAHMRFVASATIIPSFTIRLAKGNSPSLMAWRESSMQRRIFSTSVELAPVGIRGERLRNACGYASDTTCHQGKKWSRTCKTDRCSRTSR